MPLNAWEQGGKALGQGIGPNANEFAARVTTRLPLRTRLILGTRVVKRGLNPVDIEGRPVTNVGGDLLAGLCNNYPGLFHGADVYNTHHLELELEFIGALNILLKVQDAKVTGGLQLPTNRFIDFRFRYGF